MPMIVGFMKTFTKASMTQYLASTNINRCSIIWYLQYKQQLFKQHTFNHLFPCFKFFDLMYMILFTHNFTCIMSLFMFSSGIEIIMFPLSFVISCQPSHPLGVFMFAVISRLCQLLSLRRPNLIAFQPPLQVTQPQSNVWGIRRGQSMFNASMGKGGVKGWKQEGVNEHEIATKQKPKFTRYDTLTRIQESNVN